MNKKFFVLANAVLGTALGVSLLYAASSSKGAIRQSYADEPTYTLTLDASNVSPDGEGAFVIRTVGGNDICFESSGLTIEGGQLVLAADGYIKNPYQVAGNHNMISGIRTIKANNASANLTVDYTWGESLLAATPYYQRRNITFPKANAYGFLDERPNYLVARSASATTMDSLVITYSCITGVEGGDNWQLSTATLFERFKTVVNWGNTFAGQTVEVTADLDMTTSENPMVNPIHAFSGTFDGKNHTISNLTFSGDSQIAPFFNVVDGTIKNVTFANVSMTATGQRAAGAVARAERSVIENVHVASGTIQGSTQNGGIVGVIVNGAKIKDCSNAASVTGTTGANNGGILGYNVSGESQIIGCTNEGDVSSTVDGATGGLLGGNANAAGKTVEILTSEVGKDVSITANGVEASTARADNTAGFLVGSTNDTHITVTGSGKVTDEIASVSDWSDLIAASATNPWYRYQVAKLTADIDFEGTGQTFTKFAGLIDGNGHTISNFTLSGSSQIALINNCYLGGVRNLKMANVDVTATTQRAAAIAGRSEGSAFENIEVLSGEVKGAAQSGGIIGAVVIKKTTLLDCINRADVTNGTNTALGGIVGLSTSTGASIKMTNCQNYGDVTSTVGSIGGLIGRITDVSGSNLLTLKESANYGTITTTGDSKTDVSGILGSIGVIKAATSVTISKCQNRGNVVGTGNYTAGVYGGWSEATSYLLNLSITNTDNYGSVTSGSSAVGCGGIVAATTDGVATYLTLTIRGCRNYGEINGYQYVGGIAGLIRNSSTENESIIDDCYNFGTVRASGGNSACGIIGEARISVTNCGCYSEAILTPKSGSTQPARTRGETGACGYIAFTFTAACATHTGNRLINLDGTDYVA